MMRSFKFFDFRGSGEVDVETFSKAIAKIGLVVDSSELESYFRQYDKNGNGTLDYKEFSDVVFGKASVASTPDSPQKFKGLKE